MGELPFERSYVQVAYFAEKIELTSDKSGVLVILVVFKIICVAIAKSPRQFGNGRFEVGLLFAFLSDSGIWLCSQPYLVLFDPNRGVLRFQ